MSSRTRLTEVEKAYIEKFKDKTPEFLARTINRHGVGARTVEKYLESLGEVPVIENNVDTIRKEPPVIDPLNLAARHERGGVLIMTEGLSESLDDLTKKTQQIDYRGKIAPIRRDRPKPKGITIDD